MNEILIVFASATTASRARRLLAVKGYPARVVQTPKMLSIDGCSYSVISLKSAIWEIQDIIDKLNVHLKGVYEFYDGMYNQLMI